MEGKRKIDQKYYSRNRLRNLRKLLIEVLGGECIECGFKDPRALQVDHINGNGAEERRMSGGNLTRKIIRSVMGNENKYQLLCANCNWIKRFEKNEIKKSRDLC